MKEHLNVLMTDELMAALDSFAEERSYNRSEAARWAIDFALNEPQSYAPPTLPNWQVEAWTALLRGLFGDERLELTDEVKPLLEQAVAALDERSARVLRLRFGLDGPRHTLKEVGAIFVVNRQRAHQVEAKALRRLRHWLRRSVIWELVERDDDALGAGGNEEEE